MDITVSIDTDLTPFIPPNRKHTKVINGTKDCGVCRERKPLDQFNADSRNKSTGLRSECKACSTQQTLNARAKRNPEDLSAVRKARHVRLKAQCFAAYGGMCACCGESQIMFLTIDHVNDDGHVERKEYGYSTTNQYKRILDAGCPASYQVLCFNCNLGRACNGGVCPHVNERMSA